ncbi:hypothetical protein PanWU01x14_110320 [Parasponia andersonii]|uniref:Uncharacterized protein n=1 Tax=Parasponia andersonii TaxID=3476 RepID=A0A2P5CZD6_PARAD|nr:hypothetical protein PanWU01x14_110320 [Parasponia andersonii]
MILLLRRVDEAKFHDVRWPEMASALENIHDYLSTLPVLGGLNNSEISGEALTQWCDEDSGNGTAQLGWKSPRWSNARFLAFWPIERETERDIGRREKKLGKIREHVSMNIWTFQFC